jgi:hypothetical protein
MLWLLVVGVGAGGPLARLERALRPGRLLAGWPAGGGPSAEEDFGVRNMSGCRARFCRYAPPPPPPPPPFPACGPACAAFVACREWGMG